MVIHDDVDDVPFPPEPDEPNEPNNRPRRKPDRLPPHDTGAEEAVIGAGLLATTAIDAALAVGLEPRDFYRPAHGHLWASITALRSANAPHDPVAVAGHLAAVGLLTDAGGVNEIVRIQIATPATSSAGYYAKTVRAHAVRRRRLATLAEAVNATYALDDDRATELLTAARTDDDTAVAFEDVAAVMRGEVDPVKPTMLRRADGAALMYPGLTHWLMGEPGKGKTWVALHAVAEQLALSCRVMYLDWEGNRAIVGARLQALGVDPAVVEQNLLYRRPPSLTATECAALAVAAGDCSLVVCDGVAKALARQGLNEDKAPDVLAWLEMLVNPIADSGPAVLLLDHVVKEKEGRGLWARGSGAKLGEVSGAAWLVRPKDGFSRDKGGHIDLVQAKDREGYTGSDGAVVAHIGFMPDPGTGGLTITIGAPPSAGDPDKPFRPTRVMEKVSLCIEAFERDVNIQPGVNQINNDLPGVHKRTIGQALERLVTEGFVAREKGPNRQLLHAVIRPYRELDDPHSDTYRDDAEPPTQPSWDDLR